MNQKERDELVMRHLERAYRAVHGADSKSQDWEKQGCGGHKELSSLIEEAIILMVREGTPTTI